MSGNNKLVRVLIIIFVVCIDLFVLCGAISFMRQPSVLPGTYADGLLDWRYAHTRSVTSTLTVKTADGDLYLKCKKNNSGPKALPCGDSKRMDSEISGRYGRVWYYKPLPFISYVAQVRLDNGELFSFEDTVTPSTTSDVIVGCLCSFGIAACFHFLFIGSINFLVSRFK